VSKIIYRWEDVRDLLAIPDKPVSEARKAEVRDTYYTKLSLTAKVTSNDWFASLTEDERKRILKFWGFSKSSE